MVSHFFSPKLRVFFGVMTSAPAALSIGVVIPLTLTVILAVFDTNFFKRDDSFCWVRPDYVVYAVIIPITIPIINGLICSTFAIYKMFFQAKRGLANKETSHHDAEFWSKVFGLIIMQVAMGLPWVKQDKQGRANLKFSGSRVHHHWSLWTESLELRVCDSSRHPGHRPVSYFLVPPSSARK